jgi:hypothetical protein
METSLAVTDNTRNALLPIGVTELKITLGGEVGFKVDDYDLDETDLESIKERARDIAKYGISPIRHKLEKEERLSASDEAVVDLAAASIIYVTNAMGYEALLSLAYETYQSGRFFLIPGSPALVASANGPTLAFDASGNQLTIKEDVAQKCWDFWVDSLCVIIKNNNKEVSNAQIANTKSDLKRRWKRLVDPLMEKTVVVEAKISRKNLDTFVINGQEVDTKYVSDDVQRSFRGVPMGEEKVLAEEIDADWILENSAVIREMGSFVGAIDTKTEDGRQAFEDALKTYAVLNVHGFREHLRGVDLKGDEPKIEMYLRTVKEVDPATGEVTEQQFLMVPVDVSANRRWATTQLSARYTLVEEELAA